MKEYDIVEVVVEKEKYAKQGVHKGMQGTILDPRKINDEWLVFIYIPEIDEIDGINIKEEDLKVVYEYAPREIIATIKLINDNYTNLGIRKGAIGIIRDINGKDGKWEVEFGEKKITLARDEFVPISNT